MTRTDPVDPRLLDALTQVWERGYRPADVVHAVARAAPALTGLAAAAVLASVAALRPPAGLPVAWLRQLDEVRARADSATPRPDGAGLLLALVHRLPPLPAEGAPPSRWAGTTRPGPGTASASSERALGRIRALLAKAESTEFPEEAEALTAKAQELMTRHALDSAVQDAAQRSGTGRSAAEAVVVRRVLLDDPYLRAKVQLLTLVGQHNGVRVAWHAQLAMATAVGLPVDLDLVDLLFTSLLVQATRAMTATGRAGGPATRSASFRRAFLLSYAVRVGERLAGAREVATTEAAQRVGASLVPVLRDRDTAVTEVFTELFPVLASKRVRISNAQGWHAGRRAAEDADLGARRDQIPG